MKPSASDAPGGDAVDSRSVVRHPAVGVVGAPSAHPALVIAPIALAKPDAASALGMSIDSFERYVMAQVRCIRRGRLRLFPVEELRRWADENAEWLLSRHTGMAGHRS